MDTPPKPRESTTARSKGPFRGQPCPKQLLQPRLKQPRQPRPQLQCRLTSRTWWSRVDVQSRERESPDTGQKL